MLTRFRYLIFSPILITLALGSFSVYLVAKGEIEAAMGGAGAAIAAATMKRNEDEKGYEGDEVYIRLRIQALENEIQNRKDLEKEMRENMYLRFQLEMKEREVLLSLKEQELEHKIDMFLKEQEFCKQKPLSLSEFKEDK